MDEGTGEKLQIGTTPCSRLIADLLSLKIREETFGVRHCSRFALNVLHAVDFMLKIVLSLEIALEIRHRLVFVRNSRTQFFTLQEIHKEHTTISKNPCRKNNAFSDCDPLIFPRESYQSQPS
jgi:hypothetical protein